MDKTNAAGPAKLRRALGLRALILYGIVVIQPTAPMPLFRVVAEEGHGHVVTAVLLAMVAMLLTATSYGRMANGFNMPGVTADGHDFFAVHEAADEAIRRAREGGGPSPRGLVTPSA